MRKWISVAVAGAFMLSAFTGPAAVALAAQSRACEDREWDFSELALQQARGRMKPKKYLDVTIKVECGQAVQQSLIRQRLDHQCSTCRREYVQFLLDLIAYAREAAEHAGSPRNQNYYYEIEIDTRLTLSQLLIEFQDQALSDAYWTKNFEGLGDALDRTGQGERFHQQATRAKPSRMREKSFDTWTRAIRSCDTWDFKSGENREMRHLENELCAARCKSAVERIRRRAMDSGLADKETYLEGLTDVLPDTNRCPVGDQS